MNTNDFYKYIENADMLNASTVAELQDVLKSFPYFQTAHFLYLKSLYNQNNFKFNEQLKFSSVHVNNRKYLLYFLKDKLKVKPLSQEHKRNVEDPIEDATNEPQLVKNVVLSTKESLVEKEVQLEEIKSENKEKNALSFLEEKETLIEQKNVVENEEELEQIEIVVDTEDAKLEDAVNISIPQDIEREDLQRKEEESKGVVEDTISEEQPLSPQEIIARRIREINEGKDAQGAEKSVDSEILDSADEIKEEFSDQKQESSFDPEFVENNVKEIAVTSVEKEIEGEPSHVPNILVSSFEAEIQEDTSDDLVDLSGLIEVAPPSEYFLEVTDDLPDEIKDVENENSGEKHSFEDWLNHFSTESKKNKKLEKPKKSKKPQKKQKAKSLIDQFLSDKSTKIIKPKPEAKKEKYEAKVKKSKEPEIGFMTETLAGIYIKQGYYEKAIEAYTKLSLKYPKKNSYFANQIKKVKELQLNS